MRTTAILEMLKKRYARVTGILNNYADKFNVTMQDRYNERIPKCGNSGTEFRKGMLNYEAKCVTNHVHENRPL